MAELTFKSAGVSTREIDLSGPTAVRPQGVPAGIIGTAQKGPAFVPITVATYADFVAEFGSTDGKKFGPLAMNEWMRNARAGTYVRVLGVGDAKKRDDKGRVSNAGFIVGAQLPQNTGAHDGGALGVNVKANNPGTQLDGRTYFLGALMREPYDSDGEAAATSTVSFGSMSAEDFSEGSTGSPYGEGVRFLDSTGEDHLTLWFHEGASDTVNADGDTIPEDGRNVAVSVGRRHSLVLTVATIADLDNRVVQLTDEAGSTLTIEFQNGAGMVSGDLADPGTVSDTYVMNIAAVGSTTALADELIAFINNSSVEITADAKADPADSFFTVSLDKFGESTDEPDGGALTAATPNITLAPSQFGGGLSRDGAAIAQAAVNGVTRVGGLDADLVLSVSGDDLVVTQGTVGINGNDESDPVVANRGNSTVSADWVHNVTTITIPADPHIGGGGDLVAANLTVADLGTDQAGTANQTILDFDFADSRADVDADPFVVGIAASVANEVTLEIDDPAGEWHAGDTITIVELDSDGLARSTSTFTAVTGGGAGNLCSSTNNGGGSYSINFDLDHADAAGTAAQIIDAAFEDFFGASAVGGDGNYAEAGPTKLTDASFAIVGDAVTVTQPVAVRRADAVTAIISLGPNVEIREDDKATITEGDRGHTQRTNEQVAQVIATELAALRAEVTIDGAVITVEQKIAGNHTLASLDDSALTAAVTPGSGDFGLADAAAVAGTLPANLLATSFSGGGDAVESGPTHSSWEDAGIDTDSQSAPIIRAVLMAPAGVHLTLKSHADDQINGGAAADSPTAIPTTEADSGGSQLGLVELGSNQERFTILLNGHINTSAHPSSLRCSFDPQAPDYFMNVLNSDPSCLEMAGHCVYTHYDVYSDYAGVDTKGHSALKEAGTETAAAFLVHGQNDPGAAETGGVFHADSDGLGETDSTTLPNYEDFQDRFATAKSPWVISQIYGAKPKNLFKIHALDDGIAGSGKFKITISNIMKGPGDTHGKFDIFVRDISDDDIDPRVYEKFIGIDLNPNSERYIARVIGDQYMYYDFDKRPGSQKLVVEGVHPQRSKYIRVEMAPEVSAGSAPVSALPLGYRGYTHLVTSLNNNAGGEEKQYLQSGLAHVDSLSNPANGSIINEAIEPPVPVRKTIHQGSGVKRRPNASLCWGTMFQVADNVAEANNSVKFNPSILSHGKYFPTFRADDQPKVAAGDNAGVKPPVDSAGNVVGAHLDADKFNHNMFSLERIQIVTKKPRTTQTANPQVKGEVDHKQWAVAEYRRNGVLSRDIQTLEGLSILEADGTPAADALETPGDDATSFIGTRFLDPKVDLSSSTTRRYMKFSFFLQGGFDGTNIFNSEKRQLTNRAAVWEMDDANQGNTLGSTVAAFRKAIDVMAEKADVDIKLLVVPGMRDEAITDYAIDAVEDRFDAMYIMDIEEKSVGGNLMVNYKSQKPSVNLTVEELKGRNLDSSFAAAYFPDVVITDPVLGTNVQCPPSVAVLGAFSLNDSVAHPWFAPAGFSRGALTTVVETQVKLSRANLDALYESDINPLAAFPHTPGVVVWGQKTLQQAQSALDRVNVRRLLIEIRREVRRVGNNLLFEPNREETLGRFSAAVNPILQRIQQQQGLDKFKVVIDTTTTTQADIENNTVRGKIFLQPTRTVEFISLDFVVTNAGMEV